MVATLTEHYEPPLNLIVPTYLEKNHQHLLDEG